MGNLTTSCLQGATAFSLFATLLVAGCGGSGPSAEDTVREWAETNMAGTENTLDDVTCIKRFGNEYDCLLEITTSDGPITVRGTATCDDECLWRLDDGQIPG